MTPNAMTRKLGTFPMKLGTSTMTEPLTKLQREAPELLAVLKDLSFGAEMMLQVAKGSFHGYAAEVKRVADAAIARVEGPL
jgi:hypothetical protein